LNSQRRIITFSLFMVTFLAAIEGTIISTAMPVITKDLQGMSMYSWINTIYLLAMVITTPIYGKLSDMYARKKMLLSGIIIFLIGSFLSGIAWNMESLIIFRAIQGFGGGCLVTLPLIIITDMYDSQQRAKIQGWLASVWGIAGISGPLVGGLLVDFISWRAIFYMNIPFGAIALYLISVYLKDNLQFRQAKIDFPGIITLSIAILALLFGLNEFKESISAEHAANYSLWQQVLFIGCVVFGIALLFIFYRIERTAEEPFVPLTLFKDKLLLFAFIGGFIVSVINVTIIFYVPLWMQGMMGKSATFSGVVMIPLSIGWPLGSILTGQLINKLGVRVIILLGSLCLIIGSLGMATISHITPIWLIMLYTALAGFSFGIYLTIYTFIVSVTGSKQNRGAAMSTAQLLRSLGQAVGLAIFGMFIFTNELDPSYIELLEKSLRLVFMLVAILAVGMVIYIISIIRNKELFQEQGLLGKRNEGKGLG
jgi:EmrB/QacA subfamily drug resistance transporter